MHLRELSRAAVFLLVAALPLFPTSSTRAQSPQQRREDRRTEMEARQRALRTLSETLNKRWKKRPQPAEARPSYEQVAEDFTQIQLSNYNLSAYAEPGAAPDYRQITAEAAEVNRRAARLKSALALPEVEDDEGGQKKDDGARPPEDLKKVIAALDALVKSFVWNPVFRKPDVLDVENSTKAARELEEILRLSEQIRRAAEGHGKEKNF